MAALASALLVASCTTAPNSDSNEGAAGNPVTADPEASTIPLAGDSSFEESVADIEEDTDTRVAVSLYTPDAQMSVGSQGTLPVWSTIKVPIALAALENCSFDDDYRDDLIASALEWSDNDAAWSLWTCLGPEDEAREQVEEVIAEAGTTVHIELAYGMTEWSVPAQAAFGYSLLELDEDNPVIEAMSNVIEEQRWGLGTIDDAVFKGGWSDTEVGSFHSRQLGYVELDGVTYGVALAAESPEGSQEDTQDALTQVAELLQG